MVWIHPGAQSVRIPKRLRGRSAKPSFVGSNPTPHSIQIKNWTWLKSMFSATSLTFSATFWLFPGRFLGRFGGRFLSPWGRWCAGFSYRIQTAKVQSRYSQVQILPLGCQRSAETDIWISLFKFFLFWCARFLPTCALSLPRDNFSLKNYVI